MPRSEYSEYTLHVCSHMRLVVWGLQATAKAADTGEPYGWFHVQKDGALENFGEPCQAQIHRFDMEWPEDATDVNHTLFKSETKVPGMRWEQPTPSDKALYQRS